MRLSNGESALSFGAGFGLHGDSSSSCVVVDHTVVVVPEHVLWRLRALQNRWFRASEEIEQCGGVSLFPVVRLPIALKDEQIAFRCGDSGFLFTTVKQLYFKGQD